MWQRLVRALFQTDSTTLDEAANRQGFYVYRVKLPEGFKDVVSLVPDAFEFGLGAEGIIGVCTELVEGGAGVTVRNFRPNRPFVC